MAVGKEEAASEKEAASMTQEEVGKMSCSTRGSASRGLDTGMKGRLQ